MATRGAKKGSTISFYTQKEIEIIERTAKNGKKGNVNVAYLAKLLGRPEPGLNQKYIQIKKRLGIKTRTPKKTEGVVKTLQLSKDMKLQFPAKNVVVENNRIIVYFK